MTFEIENHQIVRAPEGVQFERVLSGREQAAPITPEVIVIHYAVTHNLDATLAAQIARGYFAHLSIDGYKDGERSVMRAAQTVPFNRKGSHAGESSWNGRTGVNYFSVGVEIANPGPLVRGADGLLRTVYKKVWDEDDAIEKPVPRGYPSNWTHWAKYSDEELGLLAALCLALCEHYPIKAIVSHSEIAPGRKFDPGPAFPMEWLRAVVFGGNSDAA